MVLHGDVYISAAVTAAKVKFYIDDPTRSGAPDSIDVVAPFDLGGTERDGTAMPLDTHELKDGQHNLVAAVIAPDKTRKVISAKFSVNNRTVSSTTTTMKPATTTTSTTATTSTTTSAPATTVPSSSTGIWHPAPGTSWQWQLSGNIDLSYNVAMYDVDLYDTTAATVAGIHAKGAKATCYMETGAWENYRPDAASYPASVLGKAIGGYADERYVDIRQLAILKPILGARLDLCKQKGFDAVEPDIDDSFVDVGAAGIGFPITYADQIAFNKMVAGEAHARGLAIALKNGTFGNNPAQFVNDMEPLVDFAVNEECVAADNVCSSLAVFPQQGKAVFHTEYLSDYSGSSKTNYQSVLNSFCPTTKSLGFSSILKDASESLSAWRVSCPS
jgi:hypothetical protein